MSRKRKQYRTEFKAQVAPAAVREKETVAELAARYGVQPTMIHTWRRKLVERAGEISEKGSEKAETESEFGKAELNRHIGQIKVEHVFFASRPGLLIGGNGRAMIRKHP